MHPDQVEYSNLIDLLIGTPLRFDFFLYHGVYRARTQTHVRAYLEKKQIANRVAPVGYPLETFDYETLTHPDRPCVAKQSNTTAGETLECLTVYSVVSLYIKFQESYQIHPG